jgi:hypothetical protein
MSGAIFENLCMVCWRGHYITLYYRYIDNLIFYTQQDAFYKV